MQMRKTVFLSILLLLHSGLGQLLADVEPPVAEAPEIELLGTNELSVGIIAGDSIERRDFTFRNPGKVPVEIVGIRSTCLCIRGTPTQAVIPPGGTQTITVALNSAQVKNKFKRQVWVNTNAGKLEQRRIPLYISGQVIPFFSGVPASNITFLLEKSKPWSTNFVLEAATTNLYLGRPTVTSNTVFSLAATLTTNSADRLSYNLHVEARALAKGKGRSRVHIPILSKPGTEPLEFRFIGQAGANLRTIPNMFAWTPGQESLTHPFIVRTSSSKPDPELLTIEPRVDGLTFKAIAAKRQRSSLSLQLTLSDAAFKKLQAEHNSRLELHYPDHEKTTILITVVN